MPRISAKRRVTIPSKSLEQAGLRPGDQVTIEVETPGRIVVTRVDRRRGIGVFDGLYEPDYLDRLRSDAAAGR